MRISHTTNTIGRVSVIEAKRKGVLVIVCSWCHPGYDAPNVSHTLCEKHFNEQRKLIKKMRGE